MPTTTENFPQYAGELYLFGSYTNPFLAALGAGGRIVNNFDFATGSTYSLNSGTQNEVSESDSLDTPSSYESFTRDQEVNTCQIIQKFVRTSNKMMSSYNKLIGDSSDYGSIAGPNAITDPHEHNIQATLRQIYRNLNYTCWNGVYQRATNADTAAQTRGLDAAITTHVSTVSGTVSDLEKSDIDAHVASMADEGIDTSGLAIWVGSSAKIKLSDLYSLNLQTQPRDRQIGGVNVQTLVTDFGEFPIVYDFDVPGDKIFFINMPYVSNVWCPVPEKGALFYEDKSDVAGGRTGMLYGQWGLDYGAEAFHSKIEFSA